MALKLTPITNLVNTYEITVGFMHGDADAETSEVVHVDAKLITPEQLEEIVKRFDEVYEKLNNDEPIYTQEELDADEDLDEYYIEIHGVEVPREGDCTCDGARPAAGGVDSIVYYDDDGRAFTVEIV